MPAEHNIWLRPFTDERLPEWPCPSCGAAQLKLTENVVAYATKESKALRGHEDWEPDWYSGVFSTSFACGRCGEYIACCGAVEMGIDISDEDGSQYWVHEYHPKYCYPTPEIISTKKCPVSAKRLIEESFHLFWGDKESCANRLRSALEEILTDQKIPRFTINKHKKRQLLTLHSRIDRFKRQKSELADEMFAIKLIGNTGSHGKAKLTQQDLLDMYHLIEYIISEIYDNRKSDIKKLAKLINKEKAPRSAAKAKKR